MYAAPYDLLGAALGARPDRVRGDHQPVAAGRAGRDGADRPRAGRGAGSPRPGCAPPALRFPARRPPLARLAHIRAVLAARIALEAGEPFGDGAAWWRSERRIRSAAARPGAGHVPDAEVYWPDVPASPYPGECWAIEAELTPKGTARTAAIMTGLLTRTSGWEPGPARPDAAL